MTSTRARGLGVILACAACGGCGLLLDFGDFDASRPAAAPADDAAPAGTFSLAITPSAAKATTGDPVAITITATRRDGFDEAISLGLLDGTIEQLEASPIARGTSETKGTVIAGRRHGARSITVVGSSASGASAVATLELDVRGKAGTLDTSFGNEGVYEDAELASGVDALALADDRVLVGATQGTTPSAPDDALALLRLTPNGRLDPTFGVAGRARVRPATVTGGGGGTQCLALGGVDGGAVVAGQRGAGDGPIEIAAVDDRGDLVPGFGDAGTVSLGTTRHCVSLRTASNGSLVLATPSVLVRRTASGGVDSSFASGGSVSFPTALADALPLDGGAILAVGAFRAWQVAPDGAPGPEQVYGPVTGKEVGARAVFLPDGRLLVGGATDGDSIAGTSPPPEPVIGIVRDGAPDPSFGQGGFVRGPALATTVAVVALGDLVVRVDRLVGNSLLSMTAYALTGTIAWSVDAKLVPSLAGAEPLAATHDGRGRVVVVGRRGAKLFVARFWS